MMTATTPIPAAPLPSGAHAGRLVRRAVLHHTAWLVPLLGAACVTGGQGARHPDRVRLLAPQHAGRQAKVAAWNERVGAAPSGRAIVELAASAPPPLPERVPVDPALLEAVAAADPQAAHLVWLPFEDLPRLARRRWLRSIGELVRRDRFDLKRFMPVALQPAYALDERLYALPEEVEARQVYFNRRHFAEAAIDFRRAGFDFERPKFTWEALRRVDLDLASAPRARDRLAFDPLHDGAPLELWGWQNGAEWLDSAGRRATFDHPANVEALAWLAAHAREIGGPDRLVEGAAAAGPARAGTDSGAPDHHPWLNSRLSVCLESTRFVSTIAARRPEFPLGYVEPPRRRDGAPLVSWSQAGGYVLLPGAPDAAWEVLRFLVDREAAKIAAAAVAARAPVAGRPEDPSPNTAPIPGRPLWFPPYTGQLALDLRLAESYRTGRKLLDEAHDHGLEQLRHARFRRPSPAARDIWPLAEEARRQAVLGLRTPAEALKLAQQAAQARLDAAWAA